MRGRFCRISFTHSNDIKKGSQCYIRYLRVCSGVRQSLNDVANARFKKRQETQKRVSAIVIRTDHVPNTRKATVIAPFLSAMLNLLMTKLPVTPVTPWTFLGYSSMSICRFPRYIFRAVGARCSFPRKQGDWKEIWVCEGRCEWIEGEREN